MKKAASIARILLGLLMLTFGINIFLQFMPIPEPSPAMGAFEGALVATGYMFPFLAIIQIIAGALLVINKAAPLALVIVFPVLANAFLAHLFLNDIGGIGAAVIANALTIFLFFVYRQRFYPLLGSENHNNVV